MDNYTGNELIFLKYTDGFNVNDNYPSYFNYRHNLDTDQSITKFINDGLLCIAPLEFTLTRSTIAELKSFLTEHGIKATGKKIDIIKCILNSIDETEISCKFPARYYILTEKGKDLLAEGLTNEDYADRFEPELRGFDAALNCINNNDFNSAEKMLKDCMVVPVKKHSGNAVYSEFLNVDLNLPQHLADDDAKIKRFLILAHLYGLRSESAVKAYKKRYQTDLSIQIVHKALRTILAIDDLIEAKDIAKSLEGAAHYIYRVRTMKDEKTCQHCSNLENKRLDVSKAIIGTNYPPFSKCQCDYCRCFAEFDLE